MFHSDFLHVVLVINHRILRVDQRFLSSSIFLGSKPVEVWRFGNRPPFRGSSQSLNRSSHNRPGLGEEDDNHRSEEEERDCEDVVCVSRISG